MENKEPLFAVGEFVGLKIDKQCLCQVREIDAPHKYSDGNFAYELRFKDFSTRWFRQCEMVKLNQGLAENAGVRAERP